jgi:hypothetical protein
MTRKELAAKFPQYSFTELFLDAPSADLQFIVITKDNINEGCHTLFISQDVTQDVISGALDFISEEESYAINPNPGDIIENIPTREEANELMPLVKSLTD